VGGPPVILSDKNGFDSRVYPIPWISWKKEAKQLTYFLVPTALIFAAAMYFFMSLLSVLVMVVVVGIVASLLLGYWAFGKEKRYTIIHVRTKERGKEEYKRVYWKLTGILKRILEEKGFRYEKVAEWPKTAIRVVDKGFEVSVIASHSHGEIYYYGLLIGPVTPDNYFYVEIIQKGLSQSIVEEGLVHPRDRTPKRS
jgi:hypothetical protein